MGVGVKVGVGVSVGVGMGVGVKVGVKVGVSVGSTGVGVGCAVQAIKANTMANMAKRIFHFMGTFLINSIRPLGPALLDKRAQGDEHQDQLN